MCRWILNTLSSDNLPGRRRKLAKFTFQVVVIRKKRFLKTNVRSTMHLSYVFIKAKMGARSWCRIYTFTRAHTCTSCSAFIKNVISHSPLFSPLKWEPHGGVKQLQRKRVWGNSAKGVSPTGFKIIQPVIFHVSYSAGIVLWSPLRGIKSRLINIKETLMAAVQIKTSSNH